MQTDNFNPILDEETDEGNGFDYKSFLINLLMHWPWLGGSLVVFLVGSYFYVQTLTPTYTVSSSILIKQDSKGSGADAMQDLGFVTSSTQSFDNELQILKSRSLAKKTVNSLNLYITHTTPDGLRNKELYGNSPIQVWVTPEEAQQMGYAQVEITPGTGTQFSTVITTGGNRYERSFEKLPAVFPTPEGVFSFQANRDSSAAAVRLKSIRATIIAPTAAAATYKNALTITPVGGRTTLAQLTLTTSHTRRGADYLNRLVQLYNEDANNDKNEVATKTAEFINERIQLINHELGTTESELASYKQRLGVVDVTGEASAAAGEKAAVEKAYAENETQLRLLGFIQQHLRNPENAYAVIPSNVGLNNSELISVIERYNEMLIERKRLLRTSSEDNPAVVNLDAGIQLLRENVHLAVATAEKSLLITRNELTRQERKFSEKVSDAPVQEKELLNISRQQEIKANLYLMLLQKREENNITLASTANNARVIDEPLAGAQIFPQPSQIYMMAGVVGLALPVGIIFLLGLLHFKIETRGDVEKLTRLPIVGDIPLSGIAEQNPIVISENRNDLMEEVYRSVRTNLQYMLQPGQKVILFTSTTSGEGKSFSAGNLATSFAFMGKKVVIVGLDIRKPGLNKIFRLSHKENGISQYLANPEQTELLALCQPSAVSPNLYILPGGAIPPNPTELVARPALQQAIDFLKKHFDYVILDTAPIGMVTDTQLIARVADICVYVCRSGYTLKSEFKLVNELKRENKLPHPCILLNGIDMDKRSNGSYYGYGKYGKYARYGYGKKYGYGYGYGYGRGKKEQA